MCKEDELAHFWLLGSSSLFGRECGIIRLLKVFLAFQKIHQTFSSKQKLMP